MVDRAASWWTGLCHGGLGCVMVGGQGCVMVDRVCLVLQMEFRSQNAGFHTEIHTNSSRMIRLASVA